MSQHDMVVANQTFPATRTDLNAALQALASTSKGSSRPSTVYAGQLWIDDTDPNLWVFNLYNGSADVGIGLIDTVNDLFIPLLNPFCGATSGTNTLTASLSPAPAPAAYYPGVLYTFVAGGTNTGAVTFNLDSLGARDVKKFGAVALSGGEIQAGALCILQDDGTNLQLLNPNPTFGFGNCRLTKAGGSLSLIPFYGDYLTINGVPQKVPSGGVTLSASGASSSTLYYIYAYMNSGTMTLERSTTGYAVSTSTGVAIKSGDGTRTLVGMARTDGSSTWADTALQRFVRSWFNDPGAACLNTFTTERTTTSSSLTEVNTEIRCEFLAWSGETVQAAITGSGRKGTTTGNVSTYLSYDGTTTGPSNISASSGADVYYGLSIPDMARTGLSEGYHYATLLGQSNSGGTAKWDASTQLSVFCTGQK